MLAAAFPEISIFWILLCLTFFVFGYYVRRILVMAVQSSAEKKRQDILQQAEEEAEQRRRQIEMDGRQEVIHLREEFEKQMQESRKEVRQTERRLDKREDGLDKKQDAISKRERYLETAERNLEETRKRLSEREHEIDALVQEQKDELYRVSGLSQEEAKRVLLERIEQDVERECQELVNERVQRATEHAEEKARTIIVDALQRCAAESTSETTVCTVALPSDDLKGRIIGREGRNIRSFEKATGVDVIVDDTPGVIVLSSFDSVRREAARVAMERLIADGRIHPGRIEEVTEKATEDVERIIAETGKEACYDMGLAAVPQELVLLLGRLKFRTSFGQNALQHSIEVGGMAGLMAGELGLNVKLAKRCGLLHDIGKALDHEHEGSHAALGAEEARRRGEKSEVVNSIESHHEEVEPQSLYAGLIIAADAMSASRPGARRETLQHYIKRLERLESLAYRHAGVQRAFAIQAGREIRVLVDAERMSDKTASKLSRDLAKEIEQELQYPGEVRVTVIRESRFSETAH